MQKKSTINCLMFALLLLCGCYKTSERVASSQIEVVDGDTIRIGEDRYRLKGFDTPETYRSRCAYENNLGRAATRRLRELVEGVDTVVLFPDDQRDRYGRILAFMEVNNLDVGTILISEGFARRYSGGQRQPWCE